MTAASGGPDWVGVLAGHAYVPSGARGVSRCACGEQMHGMPHEHRAHVAAALNAELVRWLTSDEPARVLSREVYEDDRGPTFRVRSALTALAALTGSDQ